jgi:hypothetical protein
VNRGMLLIPQGFSFDSAETAFLEWWVAQRGRLPIL